MKPLDEFLSHTRSVTLKVAPSIVGYEPDKKWMKDLPSGQNPKEPHWKCLPITIISAKIIKGGKYNDPWCFASNTTELEFTLDEYPEIGIKKCWGTLSYTDDFESWKTFKVDPAVLPILPEPRH